MSIYLSKELTAKYQNDLLNAKIHTELSKNEGHKQIAKYFLDSLENIVQDPNVCLELFATMQSVNIKIGELLSGEANSTSREYLQKIKDKIDSLETAEFKESLTGKTDKSYVFQEDHLGEFSESLKKDYLLSFISIYITNQKELVRIIFGSKNQKTHIQKHFENGSLGIHLYLKKQMEQAAGIKFYSFLDETPKNNKIEYDPISKTLENLNFDPGRFKKISAYKEQLDTFSKDVQEFQTDFEKLHKVILKKSNTPSISLPKLPDERIPLDIQQEIQIDTECNIFSPVGMDNLSIDMNFDKINNLKKKGHNIVNHCTTVSKQLIEKIKKHFGKIKDIPYVKSILSINDFYTEIKKHLKDISKVKNEYNCVRDYRDILNKNEKGYHIGDWAIGKVFRRRNATVCHRILKIFRAVGNFLSSLAWLIPTIKPLCTVINVCVRAFNSLVKIVYKATDGVKAFYKMVLGTKGKNRELFANVITDEIVSQTCDNKKLREFYIKVIGGNGFSFDESCKPMISNQLKKFFRSNIKV